MSKNRGSAIIDYENGIILIKRIKGYGQNKKIYYTIPGGGQEEGETIEETTRREIKEELGIDIVLTDKYYEIERQVRIQFFYLASYKSGLLVTGTVRDMNHNDYNKCGEYVIEIVPINKIKDINLLPNEIKEIIVSIKE